MEAFTNFKHRQNSEAINQALKFLYQEKLITDNDIHEIAQREHLRHDRPEAGMKQKISNVVGNLQKVSLETLEHAKEKAVTVSTDAAKKVDKTVHGSPWIIIGIASALSGVTGYILGQRFKR